MARRKKHGTRNFAIGLIVIIVVSIGVISTVDPTLINLNSIFEFAQPTASWFDDNVFSFAVSPNSGVNCNLRLTILQDNKDGSRTTFSSTSGNFNPTFTTASVIGSSGKEISQMIMTPVLVCEENPSTINFDIELIGGSVFHKTYIYDRSGIKQLVQSTFKAIPTSTRSLEGAGVFLPTTIVSASQLETASKVTSGSPSLLVQHEVAGLFAIRVFGSVPNTGEHTTSGSNRVQIIPFVEPTDPQGTRVLLDSVIPNTFIFVGQVNDEGLTASSSKEKILKSGSMIATIKGRLDNWKVSEGFPKITVTDPRNVVRATSDMTQFNIGTTYTDFTLPNFRMSPSIVGEGFTNDNIDQFKGVWKVTMQSKNDIRRVTDTLTFVLQDRRDQGTTEQCPSGTTGTFPICTPDDEPPTNGEDPIPCTSPIQLQIAFRDASPEQLISTYNILKPKDDAGTLTTCEESSWSLLQAELGRRGIDPEAGITPTPTGSAVSFIRYENFYTDLEGTVGGGGGCPDQAGQVPQEGIAISGFELLGGTANTCEGFRLSQIKLTPTLDFGENHNIVFDQLNPIQIRQDIFLAKNNPFPAKPDIFCSGSTSTSIGTCAIKNYVISESGIPRVFLTPNEAGLVKQFDEALGLYQISLVSLQENALLDKVKAKSIGLNDGDQLSLLYLIHGKIRGTDGGVAFLRDFEPMTYVQNFEFKKIGDEECKAPSSLEETCTIINQSTGEEQCTNQCVAPPPPDPPECKIPPNKFVNGQCVPDDPNCELGQVFNEATQMCEQSECQANQQKIPECSVGQFHEISSTQFDDCGDPLVICVGGDDNGDDGCPSGQDRNTFGICVPQETPPTNECPNEDEFRDQFDVCVKVNPNDGCPSGQNRNSAGICEKTAIVCTVNCEPVGTQCKDGETLNKETMQCERDFCKLDASFNLLQCFASLFGSGTAPPAQIGGIPLGTLIVVVAVGTIAIAVVTVVVRRRSGGGISV